jgi:hypothetical protein
VFRQRVGPAGAQSSYSEPLSIALCPPMAEVASRSYALAISINVFFEAGSRIWLAIALASSASFNHSAVRSFMDVPLIREQNKSASSFWVPRDADSVTRVATQLANPPLQARGRRTGDDGGGNGTGRV